MSVDKERFWFRMIRQGKDTFEIFLINLRSQLEKCHYQDPDTQLKDQIIEKCRSRELRDLAFEQDMNLEQLITTAKTLEKVANRCSRCGSLSHRSNDKNCISWVSVCSICKKRGHTTQCCFKNNKDQVPSSKRKLQADENADNAAMERFKVQKTLDASFYGGSSDGSSNSKELHSSQLRSPKKENSSLNEILTVVNSNVSSQLKTLEKDYAPIEQRQKNGIISEKPKSPKPLQKSCQPSTSGHQNGGKIETQKFATRIDQLKIPKLSNASTNVRQANQQLVSISKPNPPPPQNYSPPGEEKKAWRSPVGEYFEIVEKKPLQENETLHNCNIGGIDVLMMVDLSCPTNVMSQDQFRELRTSLKFFTAQNIPMTVGKYKFIGMFTAKILFKNFHSRLINIHVCEGPERVLKICKELAEKLELV